MTPEEVNRIEREFFALNDPVDPTASLFRKMVTEVRALQQQILQLAKEQPKPLDPNPWLHPLTTVPMTTHKVPVTVERMLELTKQFREQQKEMDLKWGFMPGWLSEPLPMTTAPANYEWGKDHNFKSELVKMDQELREKMLADQNQRVLTRLTEKALDSINAGPNPITTEQ